MEKSIVLICEHANGKVSPVTYEIAAFAHELQRLSNGSLIAVVLGEHVQQAAGEIAAATGIDVLGLQIPGLENYSGEIFRDVVSEELPPLDPGYVCIAGTSQGLDFGPSLAVRLRACCISGVERIEDKSGQVVFSRAIHGGKIHANLASAARTTVLIVQPGAFRPMSAGSVKPGSISLKIMDRGSSLTRSIGLKRMQSGGSALAEARVIVSVGRGIGKKENLEIVRRLARMFPRVAVGASRPLCDIGWLDYSQQVGQTGATVTPDLYFACGISGAPQHLAGMRGSKFIVAVNTDPNAAIFNMADVCVVEDVVGFVSDLLKESDGSSEMADKSSPANEAIRP